MHSFIVLSKIFKVLPEHDSRTFTRCMLLEHSTRKFNQNTVFISSFEKYASKIAIYQFIHFQRIIEY